MTLTHYKYKSNLLKKGAINFEVEEGDEGGYVAYLMDIQVYGAGGTVEEAADDCFSMLLDLYKELDASEAELGTYLLRELMALRRLLKGGQP